MTSEGDNLKDVAAQGKMPRWNLMPVVVLVTGFAAALLLVSMDRIRERQSINATRINAIMEAVVQISTSHLRLEKALNGGTSLDKGKALASLEETERLIYSLVRGGATRHGVLSEPLDDPEMLARAAELKSAFAEFKATCVSSLEHPALSGLGSPNDILIDNLHVKILDKAAALENLAEGHRSRYRAKAQRLFFGILAGWMIIVAAATIGLMSHERRRKIYKEMLLAANLRLSSQAEELAAHREHLSELVEKRTEELTSVNRMLREEVAVRRRAEAALMESDKQVRLLSAKLINAQEAERRRISHELHDELGQALNVTKLRLKLIETWLDKDRLAAKEACGVLSVYLDQVIEDVRRLSLCLSPTVLEDLGLTSAIRWLVETCSEMHKVEMTAEIAEVDDLIPREKWITVYRVVQEALNNIAKHAGARAVSVVIRPEEGKVAFMVEDDGKGFDLEKALAKEAPEKGLGLTTMSERIGMIGGAFELSSREGEGTRVTFSLPIEEVKV